VSYSTRFYSFWARCITDAGVGTQARFKETLGMFFEAVNIQTQMRDTGVVPDLESYIALRRDTSGELSAVFTYLTRQLIDYQVASLAGR
jgi:hypothetical protein